MRCGRCGKALIEIRIRVGGADVTLRRCGRCDSQTWEATGDEIALEQVLDLARGA
jgi:hypothetical protein